MTAGDGGAAAGGEVISVDFSALAQGRGVSDPFPRLECGPAPPIAADEIAEFANIAGLPMAASASLRAHLLDLLPPGENHGAWLAGIQQRLSAAYGDGVDARFNQPLWALLMCIRQHKLRKFFDG